MKKNIGEESKAGSTKLASYPISLEVNENSSSDLGNEDEEEAGEVLWGDKDVCQFYITTDKRWKNTDANLKADKIIIFLTGVNEVRKLVLVNIYL